MPTATPALKMTPASPTANTWVFRPPNVLDIDIKWMFTVEKS